MAEETVDTLMNGSESRPQTAVEFNEEEGRRPFSPTYVPDNPPIRSAVQAPPAAPTQTKAQELHAIVDKHLPHNDDENSVMARVRRALKEIVEKL